MWLPPMVIRLRFRSDFWGWQGRPLLNRWSPYGNLEKCYCSVWPWRCWCLWHVVLCWWDWNQHLGRGDQVCWIMKDSRLLYMLDGGEVVNVLGICQWLHQLQRRPSCRWAINLYVTIFMTTELTFVQIRISSDVCLLYVVFLPYPVVCAYTRVSALH